MAGGGVENNNVDVSEMWFQSGSKKIAMEERIKDKRTYKKT